MHTPAPIELMNVCLLRDNANRMLVQDRTDPSWPVLCFPGGHVEIGETCADAVVREMQEETGLTVVSPRLVGIKEWMKHGGQTRALVLCYEASAYTGTLTSSAEGENRWMTRAEIAAHPRGKIAAGLPARVRKSRRDQHVLRARRRRLDGGLPLILHIGFTSVCYHPPKSPRKKEHNP